jgi:hypothetical protein
VFRLPRLVALATALAAVLAIAGNYLWRTPESRVLSPSKDMRALMERIEAIMDAKDDETVKATSEFFGDLVQEEDQRTSLLQQRAANLLGTVSVVVSIILTGLSLLIKDAMSRLRALDTRVLLCSSFLMVVFFCSALFWTWRGFTVRFDFANPNLDDFVAIMEEGSAGLKTFHMLRSIEDLQIWRINAEVNFSKAHALRMATGNLFIGLFLFTLSCLYLLIQIDRKEKQEDFADDD